MAQEGVGEGPGGSGAARGRGRLWRRVLPLALIAGAAVWYFRDAPQQTTLAYRLEGRRDGLQALQIELVDARGRLVRRLEILYAPESPPPLEQRHALKLSPGRYTVRAVFEYAGGRRVPVERTFTFGGEEWVSVPLQEGPG